METFTPKVISRVIDYKSRELVSHEDYNMLFNLLIEASDYNTAALHAIINDEDTALVINADHADHATLADLASNSSALSNAVLSTSSTPLASNDGLIPTSKQVKSYIDSAVATINSTTASLGASITSINTKNNTQDGRLTAIEQVNNGYGTRISLVEGRASTLEGQVADIQQTDIDQNTTLAQYNTRITNLELQEVPENVVDTLMLKANFAKSLGGGNYSDTIVGQADKATNLLVGATPVAGSGFVQTGPYNTAIAETVSRRGALGNPAGAYYTVAELKALAPGVYSVSAINAPKLGVGASAGMLIKLSADTDMKLVFHVLATDASAYSQHLYIPSSTSAATTIDTLTWIDTLEEFGLVNTSIAALQDNALVVSNIQAGTDITVDKTDNDCVINYTGPKIVVSATEPTPDPDRTIIWIQS